MPSCLGLHVSTGHSFMGQRSSGLSTLPAPHAGPPLFRWKAMPHKHRSHSLRGPAVPGRSCGPWLWGHQCPAAHSSADRSPGPARQGGCVYPALRGWQRGGLAQSHSRSHLRGGSQASCHLRGERMFSSRRDGGIESSRHEETRSQLRTSINYISETILGWVGKELLIWLCSW